jgi:hypothetical protein
MQIEVTMLVAGLQRPAGSRLASLVGVFCLPGLHGLFSQLNLPPDQCQFSFVILFVLTPADKPQDRRNRQPAK